MRGGVGHAADACYGPRVRDPYDVLGIAKGATDDEIRAAFRKLAAQHHPDRNAGDATAVERFKEINAAYQLLSDPKKRAMFDRFGVGNEPGADPFAGGMPFDFAEADGFLGDILGAFGFGGKQDKGDIHQHVTVDFTEAVFGCEKEISFERQDICEVCKGLGAASMSDTRVCDGCGGRGKVRVQQPLLPMVFERVCGQCRGTGRQVVVACGHCRGSGLQRKKREVVVQIPPGTEDGATHVVQRSGHVLRMNKAPGDLHLTIRVRPHPLFRRDQDDVLCSLPISFPQAALGAEVEIPTLDGKGKLLVPPGTQSGTVLRVRGKGVPHRVLGGRGDQLVEVTVEVPTNLSPQAKELIEQLGQELGSECHQGQRTFFDKLRDLFG